MFNKNKKQYINILQQNKQLKITYKITQDDKILKKEQSSFLMTQDELPKDAKFKINALQKDIPHTYISAFVENSKQAITSLNKLDTISYDVVKIGNAHSVTIPKNDINLLKKFYKDTGIDFILSPFTVIEEYVKEEGKINSLNFFVYNNIIYALVYNKNKEIVYSQTKVLTSFESTQDETFLEDDIVGQKLYEELNFLEIQEFLKETVEKYYASTEEVDFLEHMDMICTLRPMSAEQIELLETILMIPISYKIISLDEYMDEFSQRKDSKSHNFINVRIKKEQRNPYFWIILTFLTVGIIAGILTTQFIPKEEKQVKIEKVTVKKTPPKPLKQKTVPAELSMISLPDHIKRNTATVQNIKMLFDVLPYDAILKDIEINKNSSTYVSNFITTSNSLEDMQSKLNNIYTTSKVLLKHKNQVTVNTIIQNDTLLEAYDFTKDIQNIDYKKFDFLSSSKATEYLKSLLIKNSIIKFDNKKRTNYLTYDFSIISHVTSPEEFFSFINKLENQKLSIELTYPIIFSKTTKSIEIKYNIKINQQNKKSVSLKK